MMRLLHSIIIILFIVLMLTPLMADEDKKTTVQSWDYTNHERFLNINFSYDNKFIISSNPRSHSHQSVVVKSVETGEEVHRIDVKESMPIAYDAYNSDFSRLIRLDGNTQKVSIISTETEEEICTLDIPEDYQKGIGGFHFFGDEKFIYCDGSVKHAVCMIWSAETGKLIRVIDPVGSPAALHPSGMYFVTYYGGRVISSITGYEIFKLKESPSNFKTEFTFLSPDGRFAVTEEHASRQYKSAINLWNMESFELIKRIEFTNEDNHQQSLTLFPQPFSSDGSKFVINSSTDELSIFSTINGEKITSIKIDHCFQPFAFTPGGKYIAVLSDERLKVRSNFMSPETGKEIIAQVNMYSAETGKLDKIFHLPEISQNETEYFSISSLVFSPDGQKLAAGRYDGIVHIWSTQSGEIIHSLNGPPHAIYQMDFNPKGDVLAVTGEGFIGTTSNSVRFYELDTYQLEKTFDCITSRITSADISPDNKLIASAIENGTISLLDFETGDLVNTINIKHGNANVVKFSPNNKILASGSDYGEINLWSIKTGDLIKSLGNHLTQIEKFVFNNDGTLMTSTSFGGPLKVWAIEEGELLHTFPLVTAWRHSIAFSPDNQTMAFSSVLSRKVTIWSLETFEVIDEFETTDFYPVSLDYSPDGSILAINHGNIIWGESILLYSIKQKRMLDELGEVHNDLTHITLNPDRSIVAYCLEAFNPTIKIWSIEKQELIRSHKTESRFVNDLEFSPDGKIYVTAGGNKTAGTIKIWGLETGALINCFYAHSSIVNSIDFSPDGAYIASGSSDKSIKILNTSDGEIINTIKGFDSVIREVIISPNGLCLLSITRTGEIALWNSSTGNLICNLADQMASKGSYTFSNDGNLLATISTKQRNKINIWNALDGELKYSEIADTGYISHPVFSPDSSSLAFVTFDGIALSTINIFSICDETIEEMNQIICEDEWVQSLSFSPDGNRLSSIAQSTTADNYREITIRTVDQGEKLQKIDITFSDSPTNTAFCMNGDILMTSGLRKKLKFFSLDKLDLLFTLSENPGQFIEIAFTQDGNSIYSVDRSNNIYTWSVETGNLLSIR